MTHTPQPREILFVDPAICNLAELLDGRRTDIELVLLKPDGQGLGQIAGHLAGRHDIGALHILSHGAPGQLLLAGETVDASALQDQWQALARIADALAPGASVLLYGCSVAAGRAGQDYIAALEDALGVEVAAAPGPVGPVALGGAWTLQSRHGMRHDLALAPAARASYPALLAAATLTVGADTPVLSAGADTITADSANVLEASDVIDGEDGADELQIAAAQTVVLGAATLTNVETITITAGIQNITSSDATVAAGLTLTVNAAASASGLTWNGAAETDGKFAITGSTVADRLTAGAGNDTLTGGGGNDTLSGNGGNDALFGESNNDTLYGGAGIDTLSGGDGNDFLYAGTDDDLIYGNAGNDGISGDAGNDTIWGGDGNDTIIGGDGNDSIEGEGGNDWLWGQGGNDSLYGNDGNDTISGNDGDDSLWGGAGNDTLSGGAGSDLLYGGSGNDTFSASATDWNGDTIADFAAGDSIIVVGADLSALNGSAASATITVGTGQTLTLTGIGAASGTFAASYGGSNTTITLVAPPPNSAPVVTSDGGAATAALSAAENQLAVTTVAATDADSDTLSYSISGGADQAKFSIDAATGVLSFVGAPDFEAPGDSDANNTYLVDVTVDDGHGGTDIQVLTVTVTDVDENAAPAITSLGGAASAAVGVKENRTAVMTVAATDADNDTLSYSISGGADQAKFSINAATGALRFVGSPNFEAPADSDANNSYLVDVTVNDGHGGTDVQALTVTVTDVFENAAPAITSGGASAAVNVEEGQVAVTTISASDEENDPLVYAISGGADQARFTINSSSGVLRFNSAPDFDNPLDSDADSQYILEITVTDIHGASDGQTLTVTVKPGPPETAAVDGVPVATESTVNSATGMPQQTITVPFVPIARSEDSTTDNAALADIPLGVAATPAKPGVELTVGLPAGAGLTASGTASPLSGQQATLDLIGRIGQISAPGSGAGSGLADGGASFLEALGDRALLTRSITPAGAAGNGGSTPAGPLTIVVSGGTGSVLGQAPDSTALAVVIDARQLPAGSVIRLENVEFAALVGAVSVIDGAGQNFVVGDDAPQTIVLGASDDILMGGGGNDTVGSAGGNDQVFGGGGNDVVFGGEGNDAVDGGADTDVLQLSGASRDDYAMRIEQGKLVLTHLGNGSDGVDTVSNVEMMRFAAAAGASPHVLDFNLSDVASLVRIYAMVFDRRPDQSGINYWIGAGETGSSLPDVVSAMLASAEASSLYGAMSNEQFVKSLYKVGLEREGTAAEIGWWTRQLEDALLDRSDVVLGFADSAEKIALVGVIDTSIDTI